MFDFIVKYGKQDIEKNIYNKTLRIFKHKKYNVYEKHHDDFSLIGLSHEGQQHSVYVNNDYLIAIIGNVFYNSNYSNRLGRINALDILNIYLNTNNILDKVKGEFTIILYRKQLDEIEVINDHFALKPVFYGKKEGCYFISNNLNLFREIQFGLDDLAILEKILFTYPISNHTLIKNVQELNGGDVLTINESGDNVKCRFSLKDMIFKNKLEKFSHKKLTELLNHSVAQRAFDNETNICSLTGGFDGRTIISSLLKQDIKFFTYSFGKKKGENTEVPLNVSKKIGIDYRPIYLEKEYEEDYYKCGVEAIYASDGLSSFDRSNYSYAYNKLSKYSHTILSGLIAGEVLRPIHLKHDYFNELYYDLIYQDIPYNLSQYIDDNVLSQFVNKEWAITLNDRLMEAILQRRHLVANMKKHKNGYLYYLYDLISMGFRKFYGNEMHLERFYADNLSPFFDYEVLSYLFSTKYIFVFKNAFNKSLLARWKGQIIYANIINNNYPELGNIPVDRGYPPKYLINPLKRFLIPNKYLARKKALNDNPSDFDGAQWNKLFFNELNFSIENRKNSYFNIKGIQEYIEKYTINDYSKDINRIVSIYYWIENL